MAWQTPITHWGQGGQTSPGIDDFNRMEENIRIIGEYNRAPGYGVATGTNAKTITLDPAPTSYYDGLCFAFKNETQNTGAVKINVNGMGAKTIKKPNGNDLPAGFLKAGSIYTVRYNGTNFILQGSDSSGDAMPEHVLAGKTFSNDNGPDQVGTMPNQGQKIIVPGTTNIIIPRGYHDGTGYVEGDSDLIPSNIKSGVNIFGVVGTLKATLQMQNGTISSSATTPKVVSGLPFQPYMVFISRRSISSEGHHDQWYFYCGGLQGGDNISGFSITSDGFQFAPEFPQNPWYWYCCGVV